MTTAPRLPDAIQSIPEALAFWAARTPEAAAIIVPGDRIITYADLQRRVGALAGELTASGVGREDRVVLLLPEGPPLIEALLGTISAAVAVPLPASLTSSELDVSLRGLHAAAALVWPGIAPAIRECLARHAIAVRKLDTSDAAGARFGTSRAAPRRAPNSWPRAEALAIVRQTSGTTGRPKRIPCLHGTLVANGRRHRDEFGVHPGDRTPAVSPLTATLGQTVLANTITAGSALISTPLTDIPGAWRAIERERPTWMSTSAGFLELLARAIDTDRPRLGPPTLRFVLATSAPIDPATCEALQNRLGAPVLPRYSATETGGVSMTWPPPAKSKPGSVGQPVQEVRIADEAGGDAGAGREGEIRVRGPRVVSGYLDDPEATTAAFLPDGWFRTGDLGYLDEDGFLFLTGRLNELINRGGEKIAPVEIDRALQTHPAVAEAAAFAVADVRLGEEIVAAVVLREGMSLRAWKLRRWLLDRLSPSKVPRRIWMVERLPRTATGKVQRRVLAERFAHRS